MKHCERCDDTGVIYRVQMTRGGETKYVRLPCPACAQIGLNSGSTYTDEKYEQLSIDDLKLAINKVYGRKSK